MLIYPEGDLHASRPAAACPRAASSSTPSSASRRSTRTSSTRPTTWRSSAPSPTPTSTTSTGRARSRPTPTGPSWPPSAARPSATSPWSRRPFLKHPKGIRDIEEWYVSTLTRPDYVHAVFERQCEIALANLAKHRRPRRATASTSSSSAAPTSAPRLSTFCSVGAFRELYMPYYKRMNDWIHAHTALEDLQALLRRGARRSSRRSSRPASTSSTRCSARPRAWTPQKLKAEYGRRHRLLGRRRRHPEDAAFRHARPRSAPRSCERLRASSAAAAASSSTPSTTSRPTSPSANVVALFDALREVNG